MNIVCSTIYPWYSLSVPGGPCAYAGACGHGASLNAVHVYMYTRTWIRSIRGLGPGPAGLRTQS